MTLVQETIKLAKTRDTPEVEFDALKGFLRMKGRCYPSDAKKFFEPLVNWLRDYVDAPKSEKTEVHIDLEYFNTTSGKILLNLFEMLKELYKLGNQVSVKWYEWESDEEKDDDYSFLDEFEGEYPFVEVIYR